MSQYRQLKYLTFLYKTFNFLKAKIKYYFQTCYILKINIASMVCILKIIFNLSCYLHKFIKLNRDQQAFYRTKYHSNELEKLKSDNIRFA